MATNGIQGWPERLWRKFDGVSVTETDGKTRLRVTGDEAAERRDTTNRELLQQIRNELRLTNFLLSRVVGVEIEAEDFFDGRDR